MLENFQKIIIFMVNTDQAVAKFQKNNALTVDGVVGKATYHTLANKGK